MADRKTLVAGSAIAAVVLLASGAALYGTGSNLGNLAAAEPCASSAETAARVAPLVRGEVAALEVPAQTRPAPALAFKGPDGGDLDLSAFKGKALLVNFWATWCGPCKAEMPALDRLQAEFGGDRFQVLALNVETRNVEKVPKWLTENWIDHLKPYTDPSGKTLPLIQVETGAAGLPTTILIDAKGCRIGVMKGPAQWDSEDGKGMIRALTGAGS